MKSQFVLLISYLVLFSSCTKKGSKNFSKKNDIFIATDSIRLNTIQNNLSLNGRFNFEKMLFAKDYIKISDNKKTDWLTNNSFLIDQLLEINKRKLINTTKQFLYKENCTLYLHTLRHTQDTISLGPYIERSIGKKSKSKLSERVLIFAMLDDKTANLIDIPPNWGYSKKRKELITTIYNEINAVVISCDTTKQCSFKDLRK